MAGCHSTIFAAMAPTLSSLVAALSTPLPLPPVELLPLPAGDGDGFWPPPAFPPLPFDFPLLPPFLPFPLPPLPPRPQSSSLSEPAAAGEAVGEGAAPFFATSVHGA